MVHIVKRKVLPSQHLVRSIIRIGEESIFQSLGYMAYFPSLMNNSGKKIQLSFICQEFFHNELGGYGGFGRTIKNIVEYSKTTGEWDCVVHLTLKKDTLQAPRVAEYFETPVFLQPRGKKTHFPNFFQYMSLINKPSKKIFIAIEWYPSYEYPLMAAPSVPLIIWIRDPRDYHEWQKLSTLDLEVQSRVNEDLNKLAMEKEYSLKKVLKISRLLKRKIIFVSNGKFLTERAKRTYSIPDLNPYYLPNPIPLPHVKEPTYSAKPTFCFLGRLDPVKRPWVFCEIAKRLPDYDFVLVGDSHCSDLMKPVMAPYQNLPNLKFAGHLDGDAKHNLLKNTWAIVNTSIHEGLPVSFLEAFSYGKCVVSCQNPDGLLDRFGITIDESLGYGMDESSIQAHIAAIERLVKDTEFRITRGLEAKKYVELNHSFDTFEAKLKEIMATEGLS